MTQSLAPCPSCSRHVNISETRCPFCKSALPALAAIPASAPTQRLTRAAAFAFTASLAVAACGGITDGSDGGSDDGGGDDGSTAGDGSATDSGKKDATAGGDGSTAADGSATDAGKKDAAPADDGSIQPPYGVPAYGLPPMDSGGGG
jgi:hypothetical protein